MPPYSPTWQYCNRIRQVNEPARPQRDPLFTSPFLKLWTFNFITFFTAFQLFPTIPFRIIDLGGSKAQAGLFLAAYTWASAISAPLTGSIADHIGRKRLLRISSVAFVVFSAAYSFITHLPVLLVVACVHGLFWSGLLSAGGGLISDVIPLSRRTEGMAYWGLAPSLAISISPPFGLMMYAYGWQVLCAGLVIMSILLLTMAGRLPDTHARSELPFPSMKHIVDWPVLFSSMTLFTVSFGYGGITSFVAVMAADRALEPRSLFFTVSAAVIILIRVFIAPIGDRIGPIRLLIPSLIVIPFAHLMLAHASSRTDIVIAGALFGLGVGGSYPGFISWILSRTDPARSAATFGSVLFAIDTGIGLGSLALGWIIETKGFTQAFYFAGVVATLASPVFVFTSRIPRRQHRR